VLECVVNVSEGQDRRVLEDLRSSAAEGLLDVHTDPHHHRSVFTLVGEEAPRALARAAVDRLDITTHQGVHPRIGVVDVVPFVPLGEATLEDAVRARDTFAAWIAADLGVPAFLYGPERSLPDIRRRAFVDLGPQAGPRTAHLRAGAVAVGARPPLVAWNVYLAVPDLELARRVARDIRRPGLRALGLAIGDEVQVSMNLVALDTIGPADAYDLIEAQAPVSRSELVGLVPQDVLDRTPSDRWSQLDLDPDRTIEARLNRL
jgi:glutamate formiminotransferase / 5-formyltetrahydrofolate cyclo-ligase